VIPAFYAQHQLEDLHVDNEILEELKQAGSGKTEQELRNVLGCFLFSDEDVFKKIKVLSGGEKSRVALAKTLLSEANFLLLDEPTNHLDFISENILIQALQQYKGSFVVVSHNRHFVSQVANKIWYIEERQIKEYPGTYEEYDYWLRNSKAIPADSGKPVSDRKGDSGKKEKKEIVRAGNDAEAGIGARDKLNKEMKKVESAIEGIERRLRHLEEEMARPEVFGDYQRVRTMQAEFDQVRKDLEEANRQWDELATKIDNADS
jgi:ATP-binding cassette subfamily F protein 3